MSTDDDAISNTVARNRGKCRGHEGCGFANRDDAKRPSLQTRRDLRILKRAIDELSRRRGFNCAARDG
jgi:hypothetical protein